MCTSLIGTGGERATGGVSLGWVRYVRFVIPSVRGVFGVKLFDWELLGILHRSHIARISISTIFPVFTPRVVGGARCRAIWGEVFSATFVNFIYGICR